MNTLEIVNILEAKDFRHDEAIKLAEAINGKSGLATKEDIARVDNNISQVKSELKEDIAEVKEEITEVRIDIAGVKGKLDKDIAEVKTEIADVKTELKTDIAEVRTEIADVKTELKTDIADVKTDIAGIKTTNKWTMKIIIAIFLAIVIPKTLEFVNFIKNILPS